MKFSAQQLSRGLCAMLTMALILAGLAASANAATEKVIHVFNGTNGAGSEGDLIMDGSGNLYGVTVGGGNSGGSCKNGGCGTVFKLSKGSGGAWTETVLRRFVGGKGDGIAPISLVLDGSGNLYGTTNAGGPNNAGSVFELSPKTGGGWTYAVIYFFKGQSMGDGLGPQGKLVFDGSGNLYGTTVEGGTNNVGTVFELSPLGGNWSESVLYSFPGGSSGVYAYGGVIFDAHGNLYGTLVNGGTVVHPFKLDTRGHV